MSIYLLVSIYPDSVHSILRRYPHALFDFYIALSDLIIFSMLAFDVSFIAFDVSIIAFSRLIY
jgi:hypothetical protein